MSFPQPSFSVQVELRNPGQFFACCGLLELAHRLSPRAEAWFEPGFFTVASPKFLNSSFGDLLSPLIQCTVTASDAAQDRKTAPLELGPPLAMRLDWWLRDDGKPNLFKTWAANATSHQMFAKWREPLARKLEVLVSEPRQLFAASERLQGSYGFDSDLGWDALKVGFSLNEHAGLKELPTRPAVELLGAIGLQRFFPILDTKGQIVEYNSWRIPLAAPVAKLAMLGMAPPIAAAKLRTRFVYRGSFKGLATAIMQGDSNE